MAKVFNLVLCVSKWHFDFWPIQDEFSALNTIESIVTSHPLLTWSWDTQYKSNKKITKNKICSFSFFVLVGLWTVSFPLLFFSSIKSPEFCFVRFGAYKKWFLLCDKFQAKIDYVMNFEYGHKLGDCITLCEIENCKKMKDKDPEFKYNDRWVSTE